MTQERHFPSSNLTAQIPTPIIVKFQEISILKYNTCIVRFANFSNDPSVRHD